jgi:hypothetical protein
MLRLIPINEINDYWADVKTGLNRVLEKAPDTWKVEDAYVELMSNKSGLYVADDDCGIMGFTILTPFMQYGDLILHIWVAVNNRNHDDLVFATDEVKKIAEEIGAKYITYSSVRKGMSKACKEIGFEPTHQNFRYEV